MVVDSTRTAIAILFHQWPYGIVAEACMPVVLFMVFLETFE
jgi:hypothetical protein